MWTALRDTVRRRKAIDKQLSYQEPKLEPQPPPAAVDTSVERVADLQLLRASLAGMDIIDVDLTPDDNTIEGNEPLLPTVPTRTGLSQEKAQRLFKKYGIKYEPNSASNAELIYDVRRVEKPIRMRIHYSCDECGTSFGNSRICSQCGHRRCRDCYRDPPKRVREMLQEARQRRQEHTQQAFAQQHELVDGSMVGRATDTGNTVIEQAGTEQTHMVQETLPLDESNDSTQYQYVVEHRLHPVALSLLQPRAQLVRRKCHECETPFEPAGQTDCQTCGHATCNLCLYETLESPEQPTQAGEQQQPAPTPFIVATVHRVYKRPRQRVRWTCEQCQALFTDREVCQACGHRRCGDCIRSP